VDVDKLKEHHKWIIGLVATAVIGPLVLWYLTHEGGPFNAKNPPPLGGDISQIQPGRMNPCCTFVVNYSLRGFRGQEAHMKTFLTNTQTGIRTQQIKAFDPVPDSDVDQASQETTVMIIGRGQYQVTFVLQDPKGTELDRMTSGVITRR
jgi:hypothetical protein